jgi:putative glutamine amidotransferase
MKKRIGISYSELNNQNYPRWFAEDDLKDDLEIVELSFLKNNTADIASCDGFVLTGGIDVDPILYEGSTVYPNYPRSFSAERDQFEATIYKYAQEHHKPLLAICRGLQLVNVLCKGTLIQDLGDDTLNKTHKGGPDKQHPVLIKKDSLLFNITGVEAGEVNSAHHQAIDTLGEGLMSNCHAPDGTMEGIEWADKKDKPFMLAIQWHPERMDNKENNPLSQKLKEQFLEAVRKN